MAQGFLRAHDSLGLSNHQCPSVTWGVAHPGAVDIETSKRFYAHLPQGSGEITGADIEQPAVGWIDRAAVQISAASDNTSSRAPRMISINTCMSCGAAAVGRSGSRRA